MNKDVDLIKEYDTIKLSHSANGEPNITFKLKNGKEVSFKGFESLNDLKNRIEELYYVETNYLIIWEAFEYIRNVIHLYDTGQFAETGTSPVLLIDEAIKAAHVRLSEVKND